MKLTAALILFPLFVFLITIGCDTQDPVPVKIDRSSYDPCNDTATWVYPEISFYDNCVDTFTSMYFENPRYENDSTIGNIHLEYKGIGVSSLDTLGNLIVKDSLKTIMAAYEMLAWLCHSHKIKSYEADYASDILSYVKLNSEIVCADKFRQAAIKYMDFKNKHK